ncbi:MAG: hypothetical protein A3E84_03195 [Gammaproteobacteria bacterium RIFCSPHIGHO2_12_FULL_42_13]|nr:MAG: hypothetical protein A3E84_03195 [Gammaproteobacteria bacterium RIFCSPHIGHO2_12_FULL_42_13]
MLEYSIQAENNTGGVYMDNGNYTVMIAGMAKVGMEDYVKRYFKKLMEHSRLDKGCLVYNIHQSIDNPTEFMVYMQWESKKAFEQHNLKPEMQEFKHKLAREIFEEQSPKTYWHLLE